MQASTLSYFTLTSKNGTTIQLTLQAAVQLACFIGYRRGQPQKYSTCYRYESVTALPYTARQWQGKGLQGTYTRFVLDWFRNRNGHDNHILFRFGEDEERVTAAEIGRVYTALIRFIAANVKGLKFPGWTKLYFNSHVERKFTGLGFSDSHPGQLVEYIDGEVKSSKVCSVYAHTENVNIPRPDYVTKLCFGTHTHDHKGQFVIR